MKQSKKPVRAYFEGEEGVFVFRPIRKVLGKDKQKMNKLTFSERRRLSAEFEKWADENDVMKKPESVIVPPIHRSHRRRQGQRGVEK